MCCTDNIYVVFYLLRKTNVYFKFVSTSPKALSPYLNRIEKKKENEILFSTCRINVKRVEGISYTAKTMIYTTRNNVVFFFLI